MDILFTNNAKTLLDGDLAIDALSVAVDDASLFPSPSGTQYFYAIIRNPSDDTDYEIVKCTAVVANTITITRAQESTSAQAWSDGDLFELCMTNGGIEDLKNHEDDHLSGGSAEIDGDKIDIDWDPLNYVPATNPSEVDSADQLSAHLYGIDQRIAAASEAARGTIELATTAEAKTGTEIGMAITPATLAAVMKQQSWMQDDGYYIASDRFRARDADGLNIEDDGGYGMHISDGGAVYFDKSVRAPFQPVLSKTDAYTVLTTDFGKSIRLNAATDKTITLPSVGSTEDGARLEFIKVGAGKITIATADSDYIFESSAGGTIYSVSPYAAITIEYAHADTRWYIISAVGTWTTT